MTDSITRISGQRKAHYTVHRASALMQSVGVCFAIYGPPGSGKSALAAQAVHSPHAGRVLVIDIEGGARAYGDRDDIDVVPIRDSDERHDNGMGFAMVEEVVDDLVEGKLVGEGGEKYGTVVLDNMSELNAYCTYDTIRTYGRNIDRKDRPDQKDWNTTTSRMLLLTRRLRDFAAASNTNVIFVAWDKQQEDRVTGVAKKDLALNPALAGQLPGLIDIVGYLTIRGRGKRTLSFEASASTAAKFRRSPNEAAMTIPGEFDYEFGSPLRPMADLISCLKGGVAFPASSYTKSAPNANRAAVAVVSGADAVAAAIRGQSPQ